jgi:hypothetical protein
MIYDLESRKVASIEAGLEEARNSLEPGNPLTERELALVTVAAAAAVQAWIQTSQ